MPDGIPQGLAGIDSQERAGGAVGRSFAPEHQIGLKMLGQCLDESEC